MKNEKEIKEMYFELGKQIHRRFLGHLIDDSILNRLSGDIVALETDGYDVGFPRKLDMICPSCGVKYDDESLFCSQCGEDLKAFYSRYVDCRICKNPKPVENKYCSVCGALDQGAGESSNG